MREPPELSSPIPIHLYNWVEGGTLRVKCLAQERNRMSLVRAPTQSAQSRDKHSEHEATGPRTILRKIEPAKCNVASLEITVSAEYLNNCFIQIDLRSVH